LKWRKKVRGQKKKKKRKKEKKKKKKKKKEQTLKTNKGEDHEKGEMQKWKRKGRQMDAERTEDNRRYPCSTQENKVMP